MSRIKKKKPTGEKIKKRADSENIPDSDTSSTSLSGSKSAAQISSLKARPEKNLDDIKTAEPNFFQKAMDFLREVKVELKKVTWPTRKQTTGTTIVVIIFVFVVSAFLGFFDFGLSKLVQVVLT